jgi:hypothetical protein
VASQIRQCCFSGEEWFEKKVDVGVRNDLNIITKPRFEKSLFHRDCEHFFGFLFSRGRCGCVHPSK